MKTIKTLSFIFLITLLTACGGKEQELQNTETNQESDSVSNLITLTKAQQSTIEIATAGPLVKALASVIKVSGRIEVPPQNLVSISFPLGGYLKYTQLLSGMHIRKGEVIAVMEDRQYIQLQQDYLTAKVNLSTSEKDYNRQKLMNQNQSSSDKAFETAEDAYLSNRISVHALSEKLRLIGIVPEKLTENNISRQINIYSPIDGFVSKVFVNIGKYVNPTDVLFEIVNPLDIHLALTVFEKDIDLLTAGQTVYTYTNAHPEIRHKCRIILIGKEINPERNVEVHCHFEQYDESLIPGTFMNAEIETRSKPVPAVPEGAVVRYENQEYVFVQKSPGTFEMLSVITGLQENGYTEIKSPVFTADTKIVNKGAYSLLMKSKNTSEEE
ncbi:MAG: efflux RND transporter periplasmic adaptor subunit [Bacteroidota bacterium]